MKSLISLLIFAIFALLILTFQYSPCAEAIKYRIGEIDPRFNISREKFRVDIEKAVMIWGKVDGDYLFAYDPQALLSINLTFDERQALSNTLNELDTQLSSQRSTLNPKVEEYNRLGKEFETRLDNLNREISHWNSQGGAPPEVYERLVREQQELQVMADRLNSMASELNTSTTSFNQKVSEFNETVSEFNTTLQQKPEEGVFDAELNRIDIYFNTDEDILIHTLAHEFGHARGLSHIPAKDSIMYAFSSPVIKASEGELTMLYEICRKRSYYEVGIERLSLLYRYLLLLVNEKYLSPN